MKLCCVFCFGIWKKWTPGGDAERAVVSLEHHTTVQGDPRDPCNHFSILTFVSEQVVPDGYTNKALKLGVCIPG